MKFQYRFAEMIGSVSSVKLMILPMPTIQQKVRHVKRMFSAQKHV